MKVMQRGFSMIELVVAISISSIVVAFATLFLTAPMDTYLAQNRRSELSYAANSMTRMLSNDVHNALANSLSTQRSGNVVTIRMTSLTGIVTYTCNENTHTLLRTAGASAALVADKVSACEAWTRTGHTKQHDLLDVNVQFTAQAQGATNVEQLHLFKQFAVAQLP